MLIDKEFDINVTAELFFSYSFAWLVMWLISEIILSKIMFFYALLISDIYWQTHIYVYRHEYHCKYASSSA